MYEELVKRLRSHNGWALNKTLDEAADAIEELQGRAMVLEKIADKWCEAVPKWIPMTERLPDVFKHVLVNIPGVAPRARVKEAFRAKNGMWYSNGFRYSAEEITHWIPLPEPPKEGE